MEADIKKLKLKMFERDVSISKQSKEMNIGRDTLANKLRNSGQKLKLEDMHFMIDRLQMTDDEILDTFFIRKAKEIGFKAEEQD